MFDSISDGLFNSTGDYHVHDLKTLANPVQFTGLDVLTTTDSNNEIWFCAKDVCTILVIYWSGSEVTLQNMPENWKGVLKLTTPGGEQNANFINEANLYHLIFRSNKAK